MCSRSIITRKQGMMRLEETKEDIKGERPPKKNIAQSVMWYSYAGPIHAPVYPDPSLHFCVVEETFEAQHL